MLADSSVSVDMTGEGQDSVSELAVEDIGSWLESYNDLWSSEPDLHIVGRFDPQTTKLVATVANLTVPNAGDIVGAAMTAGRESGTTRTSEPGFTKPIEFAQLNRRSMG